MNIVDLNENITLSSLNTFLSIDSVSNSHDSLSHRLSRLLNSEIITN